MQSILKDIIMSKTASEKNTGQDIPHMAICIIGKPHVHMLHLHCV